MTAPSRSLILLLSAGVVLVPAYAWLAAQAGRSAGAVPAVSARALPPRVDPRPLVRAALGLPQACRAAGVAYPLPSPRVVVRKAYRRLQLYEGGILVKEYPIGLGRRPGGDKDREGDGRTPDGRFTVCTRVERSQFRHFLGLSYPDPAHARPALASRRITPAQAAAIRRAFDRGEQPPWDTPLGGAVGIHGGGSGADWTLGCIALDNPAVDELFAALPLGTPVRIEE